MFADGFGLPNSWHTRKHGRRSDYWDTSSDIPRGMIVVTAMEVASLMGLLMPMGFIVSEWTRVPVTQGFGEGDHDLRLYFRLPPIGIDLKTLVVTTVPKSEYGGDHAPRK